MSQPPVNPFYSLFRFHQSTWAGAGAYLETLGPLQAAWSAWSFDCSKTSLPASFAGYLDFPCF